MDSLYNYLTTLNGATVAIICTGIALVLGTIFTLLVSIKLRASKSFFITSLLMPTIIASIIGMMSVFLSGTTSMVARIASIAVALGLIRFRSVNARAEELLILFAGIAIGVISGLGYALVAALLTAIVALVYLACSFTKFFDHRRFSDEKLLKITIPESLEYNGAFDEVFARFVKDYALVGVKTTDMGSLFKLSYKITLNNLKEEKEFIDELRTKNGNLEISILPYVENSSTL